MMEQSGSLPIHRRFNELELKKSIENRYKNISKAIPRQLTELKGSHEFATVVKSLRKKCWKDWHVLLAVINAVINLKHKSASSSGWHPQTEEERKKMANFKEDYDFKPYPVSEFTEDTLQQYLHFALLSVCKTMGFAFRRQDVKIDKVENFLKNRMLFFDLDVEHDPFFPLADDTESEKAKKKNQADRK